MLKYRKNKKMLYQYVEENREAFKKFDSVEMTAAMVLLGEQKRLAQRMKENEEEVFDMCEAIDELIEDGRQKGRKEGRLAGQSRINLLNQKLKADGKMEELLCSIDDPEYQKKLLEEYGL